MAESFSRRRTPALPQIRPATAVQPLSGGQRARTRRLPAQHERPNRAATRRHYSSDEVAVLALFAVAAGMVMGLVAFTILRDTIYLNQSVSLVAPLNP